MGILGQLFWIAFVFSCMWGSALPGIALPGVMLFPLRVFLIIILVADLFNAIYTKKGKIIINKSDYPPIAILLIGILTLVWSCNRESSVSAIMVYLTSALVLMLSKRKVSHGSLQYILNAIYVNMIIMGIAALYESITGQYLMMSYEYYLRTFNIFGMIRPKAAFFNTNNLAVFFIISLPMALLATEKWKFSKLARVVIFFFSAIIVILTGSRMGITGLLLCLGLYIFYRVYSDNSSKRILGMSIGLVIIAMVIYFMPSNIWSIFEGKSIGDETRWEIWKAALQSAENYAFMGAGIGTSKFADGSLGSPHNYFLEILLEFGILGLIAFLFLVNNTLPSLKKARSEATFSYLRMLFWLFLLSTICASTLQGFYFIWLFWGIAISLVDDCKLNVKRERLRGLD